MIGYFRDGRFVAEEGDRTMSFDEKCFDLAEYFLPDSASQEIKNELAQVIQTAIEDHLGFIGECESCGAVPATTVSVTESTETDRGTQTWEVPMKLCSACEAKGKRPPSIGGVWGNR